MISFCKKSVHSLFNTPATLITSQQQTQPSAPAGLSILITNHDDVPKPTNVIESWSLMINRLLKIEKAVAPEMTNSFPKQDHIEFSLRRSALGGGVADRLDTCTESLGFESCTEITMMNTELDNYFEKTRAKGKSKIAEKKKEKMDWRMKVFPPPLKHMLNANGKRVFALRPVRKDGRLQLTEVQLFRNESFYACRENGRLIMHLVEKKDEDDCDCDVNVGTTEDKLAGDTNDDEKVVEKLGDAKGKKVVEEMNFPENCSGGEDCRWLNEMAVSSHGHHEHHHHHNMHGWGQQSVTIR